MREAGGIGERGAGFLLVIGEEGLHGVDMTDIEATAIVIVDEHGDHAGLTAVGEEVLEEADGAGGFIIEEVMADITQEGRDEIIMIETELVSGITKGA